MSTPAEPQQRQLCARFCEGRRCPKGRSCPFIHKWALYYAAKKEKRLAKLKDSHGDAGSKPCAHKHGDTSVDMPQKESVKLGDSRNATLVQIQHVEMVAQTPSAARKRTEQHVKDAQSSKLGNHRGKNCGKKTLENIDHVQTAVPADKTPKTVKDAEASRPAKLPRKNRGKKILEDGSHIQTTNPVVNIPKIVKDATVFKLNNPSPNRSSGQHLDKQTTEGSMENMAAPSINTQWANSRWPKPIKYGGNHASNNGPRTTIETEVLSKCNGLAKQVVEVRDARMRYYGHPGQKLSAYGVADRKPLKQFTLFRELPFEIRLVVWQIAIRFAYNPTIRLQPIRENNGSIIFHDVICQSLTPIVLRINQESRAEALKHYTLSLGNTTYLNNSTSTVFLDSDEPGELTHFVASIPHQELRTIENFAVRLSEWSWMDETFKEAMWQFTNIKRLAMMFSKSDDSFYLTKSAYKLIHSELKKPKDSSDDWKAPIICLVPSYMVEGFLKSNTFA